MSHRLPLSTSDKSSVLKLLIHRASQLSPARPPSSLLLSFQCWHRPDLCPCESHLPGQAETERLSGTSRKICSCVHSRAALSWHPGAPLSRDVPLTMSFRRCETQISATSHKTLIPTGASRETRSGWAAWVGIQMAIANRRQTLLRASSHPQGMQEIMAEAEGVHKEQVLRP